MKRGDRRNSIIDLLVSERAVDLTDLADRFAVSKMTIHRDLDELESAGLLRKVRGGATIEPSKKFESDFRIRELQGQASKARMARAALDLIEPGMTVMVNDGTTAALLGGLLGEKRPVTVISNNAAVIDTLKREPGVSLIALGGNYSSKYNGFFGVLAEQALDRLRADIAIISTPAISGLRAFHMDEDVSRTKSAMMRAAEVTCLMVDHARFGHGALHAFAGLDDFDVIISDKMPSPEYCALLEGAGIRLMIAKDPI